MFGALLERLLALFAGSGLRKNEGEAIAHVVPRLMPGNRAESKILESVGSSDDATFLAGTSSITPVSSVGAMPIGSFLLDAYRLDERIDAGGMGTVWRVRHLAWDADLAMKQPQARLFHTEKQKKYFSHECEVWIDLGLHPHVVTCYYVREIEGVPAIFAEWMSGGSLKDWMDSGKGGRLYEGDERDILKRVLDISIQFARGLRHAHEQGGRQGVSDGDGGSGLIHRDVKPGNLLLTLEGEAKVSDFGLSLARAALAGRGEEGIGVAANAPQTSASAGYTPAYCSPEQYKAEPLTRATDIYSWAVSVLEMFLGRRPWRSGVLAGLARQHYFAMEKRIAMPRALEKLLDCCLHSDPKQRPPDFAGIERDLLAIYQTAIAQPYPRPMPKSIALTAGSLNNRALSLLDLGKPEAAKKSWAQALEVGKNCPDALFNCALYHWRNTLHLDLGYPDGQADLLMRFMHDNNFHDTHAAWLYANFCLERCDLLAAEKILAGLEVHPAYPDAARLLRYARNRAQKQGISKKIAEPGAYKHFHPVRIAFSEEGDFLYVADLSGMKVFTSDRLEQVRQYAWPSRHHGPLGVRVLGYSPGACYVVLVDVQAAQKRMPFCLHVLETKSGHGYTRKFGATTCCVESCLSPDSEQIFLFDWGSPGNRQTGKKYGLDILALKSGKVRHVPFPPFLFQSACPDRLIFSPDTQYVLVLSGESTRETYRLILLETRSGLVVKELSGRKKSNEKLYEPRFSLDQQCVVVTKSTAERCGADCWDLETGECVYIPEMWKLELGDCMPFQRRVLLYDSFDSKICGDRIFKFDQLYATASGKHIGGYGFRNKEAEVCFQIAVDTRTVHSFQSSRHISVCQRRAVSLAHGPFAYQYMGWRKAAWRATYCSQGLFQSG